MNIQASQIKIRVAAHPIIGFSSSSASQRNTHAIPDTDPDYYGQEKYRYGRDGDETSRDQQDGRYDVI